MKKPYPLIKANVFGSSGPVLTEEVLMKAMGRISYREHEVQHMHLTTTRHWPKCIYCGAVSEVPEGEESA